MLRVANRFAVFLPELRGLRRASLESVVVGFIGQGTLVITGVLLARELGPRDRGYAALLALAPVIVSQLGELGVPNAVAYFIARDKDAFLQIVELAFRVAKPQAAISTLSHAAILAFFLVGKSPALVGAAAVTLLCVPAYMAGDYGIKMLQGQQRFRTLNLLRLVYPAVVCPGLLVLLVFRQTSLVAAMIALTGGVCASGAAFLVAGLRHGSTRPWQHSPVTVRHLLRFGLDGLLGSTYVLETFRIDQLAVGLFLSPVALGLYVVGFAFSNIPGLIAQSLGYVAYPGVAAGRDRAHQRRIMWQFVTAFAVVSLATVAALESVIAKLVPLFFGSQFVSAIGIARIALVAGLLLSARRILGETLRGAGHPLAGTFAEGALLTVFVSGAVVGSHYLGAVGVAGAVAVSAAASLLVLIMFEARVMRKPEVAVRPGAS